VGTSANPKTSKKAAAVHPTRVNFFIVHKIQALHKSANQTAVIRGKIETSEFTDLCKKQ
jgi:hypothetical protein